MQFDTTINPLQFNIAISEDDGHLEFVVVTGTLINLGQGQMLPLPLGVYRLPLPNKGSAQEFYEQLGKAIDKMPEDKPQSNITIASSVSEANHLAESMGKLTDVK